MPKTYPANGFRGDGGDGMKKATKATKITVVVLALLAAVVFYYGAEVMLARATTAATVETCYKSGRVKMTANDLSPSQRAVLLKIEDPDFYGHRGVDFHTPGAGWTTITQGLAKGFYFEKFQSGPMKIKQTLCARFALDPLVDKETQLTLFINLMYFGNGVYGLTDAAAYYFHKPVAELTEDEYIALIGCLISPNRLNVKSHPRENAQRVQRIKKVLSGVYTPKGLFDITYEDADKI